MNNRFTSFVWGIVLVLLLGAGGVQSPLTLGPATPDVTEIARVPDVWIGQGTLGDPYRARLLTIVTTGAIVDVTGQTTPPSTPPGFTVEVYADPTYINVIFNDGDYGSGSVLWVETEPPRSGPADGRRPGDGVPGDAEFTATRAHLVDVGMSTAQIDEAIGTAVNGRTRAQIETALRNWQQPRVPPKGLPARAGYWVIRDTRIGPECQGTLAYCEMTGALPAAWR